MNFGPALLVWGAAGARVLIAVALLGALSLIGVACLPRRWWPGRRSHLLLASLSVGATIFAWIAWLAGSLVATRAVPVVFLLLLACSLHVWRDWWRTLTGCCRYLEALAKSKPFAAVLLLLPVCLLALQLPLPLADSDGLRYHVALPKLFLLDGHIHNYVWDVNGALPQSGEMLFILGLLIAGGETCKYIHAGFFLASLAALAMLTHKDKKTRVAGLLAPFLFALSPVVLAAAGTSFVDHIALFHLVVAAILAARRGKIGLVGLAAGGALATKVTTAPFVLAVLLFAVLTRPRKGRLRMLAVAGLLAVLPIAPVAIRNTLATGDPLFPVGHYLVGRAIPGVSTEVYQGMVQYHGGAAGPLGMVWGITPDRPLDDVIGWHHLLGLGLVLAVFWVRAGLPLIPFVLAGVGTAFFVQPTARYFLPLLWALAGIEALVLAHWTRRWAPMAALVIALPAFWGAALVMTSSFQPAGFLLGRENREAFLIRNVPGYRAGQAVNRLGPGVIMAVDFPCPYYLDQPYIVEGNVHEPPLVGWIASATSAGDVLGKLQSLGVRHLLITPGYGGGTPGSMMPLAKEPRTLAIVSELRSLLQRRGSYDGVDIYEVPAKKTQ